MANLPDKPFVAICRDQQDEARAETFKAPNYTHAFKHATKVARSRGWELLGILEVPVPNEDHIASMPKEA